jgi:hypothetical protein
MDRIKPSYIVGGLFALFAIGAVVFVLTLAIILTSGDEEQQAQASPTPPAVANLTRTPTSISAATSPTPLPTAASGLQPTPTQLQFPTSAPPPTQVGVVPTSPSNVPTSITITSPVDNVTLQGYVTILGSASHPNFVQYALEYGPNPNPSNLWYPITTVPITRTVVNSALGAWNTLGVSDGNYQIRLHVWLSNGVENFDVVAGLQVKNSSVPTPSNNQNPTIDPISAISITKGKSVTIALGMRDPNNDPLTYLAQVANPNVASVSPSGAAAITIGGVNEGSTSITVTINDGRGGTASTSFSVTVTKPPVQNNPPVIAPIPAQSLLVGQTLNIAVNATDPENDAISLTTSASVAGIATPSIAGKNLTIQGVSQGSVSINVTATDAKGLNTTVSFVVTVTNPAPANKPPTIAPVGNQTVEVAKNIDVALTVTDPDNDPLTLTASSSNSAIASAQIIGSNQVRVSGASVGSASITVQASDGKGGTATTSFNVTVNPTPNNNPVLNPIQNQTCKAGDTLSVAISYSDPDNDAVTPVNPPATSNPGNVDVSLQNNTNLSVSCKTAGAQATITVTVQDSKGATAAQSFNVSVEAPPNQPPVVDAITNQTCNAGDVLSVSFSYSDPNGDSVTPTNITSNNPGNIDVSLQNANTLAVNCNTGGTSATITVTVQDNKGANASQSFNVDVTAVNNPPVVDPISDQNCTAGDVFPVSFTYSDPDGDTVTPTNVGSDNPGNINVTIQNANTLSVSCNTAGVSASITVNVQDSKGASASQSFAVSVAAPVNNPPVVDGIAGQTCNAGDSFPVVFTYSDPDGNPVTPIDASSDNPGVVGVGFLDANTLQVDCFAPNASATITVTVQDDQGATASQSFSVNVSAPPNNPPTVDGISDQTCNPGDSFPLGFTYSDPDGNPVSPIDASSDNPGAVGVGFLDANTLQIDCISPNSGATITVTVQDDQGFNASASFFVSVGGGGGGFDVTQYAEVPSANDLANLPGLANTYNQGQALGNQKTIISVAGDEVVGSSDFLDAFATGPYSLGNYGYLQPLIDFYTGGQPNNTFNMPSYSAGNSWTTTDLLNAQTPAECGGASPLVCELNSAKPAVMFVGFKPSNAVAVPVDVFKSELNSIVATITSAGTIPVLMTLPDDGSIDAGTLSAYNQAIVEVATNANIPLLNIYVTMQPVGAGQVYAVGGANSADLTASQGANQRNRAALEILGNLASAFFQ